MNGRARNKSRIRGIIWFAVLLLCATACSKSAANEKIQAVNLIQEFTPQAITGKNPDDIFIRNITDFSIKLFQETISSDENSLVSPLSVMLALAITANGADKETLAQMEWLLGNEITLAELNEYLHALTNSLSNEDQGMLRIANSIWLHDNENHLTVESDFLQTNANYYNADTYRAPFDSQTLSDINHWVNVNTDGLIDRMIDQIDPNAVMYIINAMVFDAEWERPYLPTSVYEDSFTLADGNTITIDMMRSTEYKYLDDGQAIGFIKPYANEQYSFVALLPNENMTIDEYIESMSGESWLETIQNADSINVHATLPKFSYDYSIRMKKALIKLGMRDAFFEDTADFSRLGQSSFGNLFIGDVLHKTYIATNELGTKAGAATIVDTLAGSSPDFVTVKLDRAFVYAIIDHTTGYPIFIGTFMG